ncbi:MAG: type II toxin-antitoxin system RelE/ParE family toxin [Novosphingobium sp.]|nr:type II toxin-antitoxin system RelE/ParE family toxin [Novosphingobium sp.]
MQIHFSQRAIDDLDAIIAWYDEIAPDSTRRIVADIERALRRLQDFPQSGPATGHHELRRIVTLRYHFKIAYRIAPTAIVVIGIFRHQDRIA